MPHRAAQMLRARIHLPNASTADNDLRWDTSIDGMTFLYHVSDRNLKRG